MTRDNRARLGGIGTIVTALLTLLAWWGQAARAQIVTDGSLGPAQALAGPAYTIAPGLGRIVGNNLFHSFNQFDLVQGDSATFTGPSTLQNIVARVTGGASSIDGTLATQTGGTPALFLINPAGIVFGPHASLHLEGAFHVSTADYLRFADGARFQANLGNGSSVTAAPPAAFGFLSQTPAALAIDGATLAVKSGATIDAVAGDLAITGGGLATAGGAIRVMAAGATGEVPLDPMDTDHLTVTSLGTASLTQGATINVGNGTSAANGGRIDIRAGSIRIDNSAVTADSLRGARGRPGQVSVSADDLTISNGGAISASTFGNGNGGSLTIAVRDTLDIEGDPATALPTGILADSEASAAGNAGNITVTAGIIRLGNGGQVSSSTFGRGNGGDINLATAGTLEIDGAPYLDQQHVTGVFSFRERALGLASSKGNAGNVQVVAGSISLKDAGVISSSTLGDGNGGAVTVSAAGAIEIDGAGSPDLGFGFGSTGILSEADSASFATGGGAGPVTVHAASIRLSGNGKISSDSGTSGGAGDIAVTAPVVTIDGGSISSTTFVSGKGGKVQVTADGSLSLLNAGTILTQTTGSGAAGEINVEAGTMALSGGALLSSSSSGSGTAGTVGVTVAGDFSADGSGGGLLSQAVGSGDARDVSLSAANVTFSGGAKASSDAGVAGDPLGVGVAGAVSVTARDSVLVTGLASAISADALGPNSGRAGKVAVTGSSVTVADHGAISTTAAGPGDGGDIKITADEVLIDGGRIDAASSGAGSSGTIDIDPRSIVIQNQGVVSALASGAGASGRIRLATDSLVIRDSSVTTTSARGGGGEIAIQTTGLFSVTHGLVTTTVHGGTQTAGNIDASSGLLVLGSSFLSANADRGRGGNLTVTVNGLVQTPDSAITASSNAGLNGTVAVSSLGSDVTAGLAELSGKLATTGDLSHLACGGLGHGGSAHSSLLVLGRGALPFDADDALTAYFADATGISAPSPAAVAPLPLQPCSL